MGTVPRVFRWAGVRIVTLRVALSAQIALAQVRLGVPAARQQFPSGGAMLLDMSTFAPGPTNPTGGSRPRRMAAGAPALPGRAEPWRAVLFFGGR